MDSDPAGVLWVGLLWAGLLLTTVGVVQGIAIWPLRHYWPQQRVPRTLPVAGGILAVWSGLWLPVSVWPATVVLLGLLVPLAVLDAHTCLLPDRLTLPLLICGLGATAWLVPERLPAHGVGIGLGWGGLYALAVGYRWIRRQDGLGDGDPRLLGAAGAWVGWEGLPGVLLWASFGALAAISLNAVWQQRRPDPALRRPFGPWLAGGLWLVWLHGPLALG